MIKLGIDTKMNNFNLDKVARELNSLEGSRFKVQGSNGSRLSEKEQKLKEVCTDFEAIFIEKLWGEMKKSVSKDGFFNDPISNQYMDLFDFEFSKKLAKEGGIGLSKFLYNNLVNQLEKKSEHTEVKKTEVQKSKINITTQIYHHKKDKTTILDKVNEIAEKIEQREKKKESNKIILPVSGEITSYFGIRKDPFSGERKMHNGIDIAAPIGTKIKAATGGEVIYSGERPGYGKVVIIKNSAGLETIYAHNKENLVNQGDIVNQGDVIATVGITGRTTGPHVHFEVRINNKPINPLPLMEKTLYAKVFLNTRG